MATRKVKRSVLKRQRQNLKRRARNRLYIGTLRKAVKRVKEESDPQKVLSLIPWAYSIIDRVAKKGIIHKNAAARYKSRLMAWYNKRFKAADVNQV